MQRINPVLVYISIWKRNIFSTFFNFRPHIHLHSLTTKYALLNLTDCSTHFVISSLHFIDGDTEDDEDLLIHRLKHYISIYSIERWCVFKYLFFLFLLTAQVLISPHLSIFYF